jgi:hypothetical protein
VSTFPWQPLLQAPLLTGIIHVADATMSASGTMVADAGRLQSIDTVFSANGSMTAAILKSIGASSTMSAAGSLSAVARLSGAISSILTANGSMSGSIGKTTPIAATMTANGSMSTIISLSGVIASVLTANGILTADASVIRLLVPIGDITDGNWTNEVGSNVNLYASIDEYVANDSDFIQSSGLNAGSSDTTEVLLAPTGDPAVSTGHIVQYRYRKQGVVPANVVVSLYQGTTLIASWTHTNVLTPYADASQTLTGLQADSITDYSDLRLRFVASA